MKMNEMDKSGKAAILAATIAKLEEMGKEPQVTSTVSFNDNESHFITINGLGVEDGDSNLFPTPTVCFEKLLGSLEAPSFAVNAKVLADRIVELISEAVLKNPEFPTQNLVNNENEFSLKPASFVPALCDKELNKKFLSDKPHIDVGNGFALFLRAAIAAEEGYFASNVNYEMLRVIYGITEKEAFENVFRGAEDSSRLFSMTEMIFQGFKATNMLEEDNPVCTEDPMYILTDELCGAAVLYRPGLKEKVAEILNDDFYVLPSSIHEFIIVLAKYAHPEAELAAMVEAVNQESVHPQDILSYRVQKFIRRLGKLIPCTTQPKFS